MALARQVHAGKGFSERPALPIQRMRAMILFLLDTGVRSSELVSIELCDVVFDEGRVRVLQGKGRRQRWTAISEVALYALRTYLDDFRDWSEGHLFQTFDGRTLRNHHMNVMFTRHGVAEHRKPQHEPQAEALLPEDRDDRDQNAQPDAVEDSQDGIPRRKPPRPDADQAILGKAGPRQRAMTAASSSSGLMASAYRVFR